MAINYTKAASQVKASSSNPKKLMGKKPTKIITHGEGDLVVARKILASAAPEPKLPNKAPKRVAPDEPKEPTTIRLDRDVKDWFRSHGRGWQTTINSILRDVMEGRLK